MFSIMMPPLNWNQISEGLITGCRLEGWGSVASFTRDFHTGNQTVLSALAECVHVNTVRNISTRAATALGVNYTFSRITCRFIDFSPLILFGVSKVLPSKSLQWVQNHETALNRTIAIVGLSVLLAMGQYQFVVPSLFFVSYNFACQKRWIDVRTQTVVNRVLTVALTYYNLRYGSLLDRIDTICRLISNILNLQVIKSCFPKQLEYKLQNVELGNHLQSLDIEDFEVNKSYVFAKESNDPNLQWVLTDLAAYRVRGLEEELQTLGVPPSLGSLASDAVEVPNAVLQSLSYPVFFLTKKIIQHVFLPNLWEATTPASMVDYLVEHSADKVKEWAKSRNLEVENDEAAKLLLCEMGVFVSCFSNFQEEIILSIECDEKNN